MERDVLKIIGYPLAHSLSPRMQGAAIKSSGLSLTYEMEPLALEDLPLFIQGVKSEGSPVLGFNITIPYKEAIIPYLDEISREAKTIGAVNTVKYEDGLLKGYNTDGLGLLASLDEEGVDVKGKKVLIIGTGGAARGIAIPMVFSGMGCVDFVGRNGVSGMALRDQIKGIGLEETHFYPMDYMDSLPLSEYDLIIQTTPVEMEGMEGHLLFPHNHLKKEAVLVDIVYAPPKTPFLMEGERLGHQVINGLGMLIHQGALAFKIWTGRQADVQEMERAIRHE